MKVPNSLDIRRANKLILIKDEEVIFQYLKYWIESCFADYWKSEGHCTIYPTKHPNQCVVISDMITKQNLEYLSARKITWDTITATDNKKCLTEMRIKHLPKSMRIKVPKKYFNVIQHIILQ